MSDQMASRFGNSVVLQPEPVANTITTATVFDTGTVAIASVPQVVTVNLSIDTPVPNSDQIWALLEVGCGGSTRVFEVDWLAASQISFAADRVRVDVKRKASLISSLVKVRACLGDGQRSTSAAPPSYSTDMQVIPALGSQLKVNAPPHAKSFSIVRDDFGTVGKGLRIIQEHISPDWQATLTDQEYRDLILGKYTIPVVAPTQSFEHTLGGGSFCRIRYYLDL